jgi:mRNA-degrading endonuclease YafQ of YafQ-DinJ toxin-antitoxin module
MRVNPFDLSLKTHQVNISSQGKVWSSRVTGDLRLIWEFDEDMKMTIIALRLQGHDTVYS